MEEITADSVLDVIGTEENIQRLVKQDQKLAAKVGQVVKALAEKLRQLMNRFAKHSPEARALSDDLEYTEKIVQMMEEALAAARENYRMAQEGQFTAAKQDAAVQAYISDMQTAATTEDAQAAMNGLVSDLFARSQTAYLAARPDMDLNDAVTRFGEALKSFGMGESPTVQGALARAGFNSPQDGDSILAPLAYAGKKLAGMEERGMETETKYQMKTNPRVDEKTLEENKKTVSAMNPVKELTGDEFTVGGSELRNQVAEYFEQIGATAYNDELGDVELTRRGIKDSVSHGIGKEKAAAFAAVKEVIEQGKIIDKQDNWKKRQYDTFVISAPIAIGGTPYYMGVVVNRSRENQRYYLHEVITQKAGLNVVQPGEPLVEHNPGNVNPTINSILETVRNYKGETEEKVSTDSDNSYDLKEQSLTAQVSQDAALHSQMRSNPSIRAAAELMQKLHRVVRRGDGYLQGGENEPVLKARAWDKRRGAIADKILSETGSTMSRNTLMRRLSTLYRGMDRLDMDTGEMLMYARSVGRQLLENSPGMAR